MCWRIENVFTCQKDDSLFYCCHHLYGSQIIFSIGSRVIILINGWLLCSFKLQNMYSYILR